MPYKPLVSNTKSYSLLSAIVALLLWGGWAYHVNHAINGKSGLVSGLTQGIASFIITLFMIRAVTWFYHHLPKNALQILLPALLTVCITGSCLFSIHYLVGTPDIIHTISPALTVAFVFCLYTTLKLRRAKA